jgi:hypothetical protein
MKVNLGGEGEAPGAINQQGPWVLDPLWRSTREGKTLKQLQTEGHRFVISNNLQLPIQNDSVEEVITNNVPIDRITWLGPGVQSKEIHRILKPGGHWVHDAAIRFTKP